VAVPGDAFDDGPLKTPTTLQIWRGQRTDERLISSAAMPLLLPAGYEPADCQSADAFHPDDARRDASAGSYSYSVLHSSQTPFGHSTVGLPKDSEALQLPSMRR
jgi:hypothetical protein